MLRSAIKGRRGVSGWPITKWEALLGRTDSPIERDMLTALCECAKSHGYRIAKTPQSAQVLAIKPQQWVGKYRADFVLVFRFFGADLSVVVECDGHDFHEKTKFQASCDKKRDRFMVREGYRLMRFSGSDIARSAKVCAEEVLDLVMSFQTARIESAMKETSDRSNKIVKFPARKNAG